MNNAKKIRSIATRKLYLILVLVFGALLCACLIFASVACSQNQTNVRVDSLKGPTSIGLAKMMQDESLSSDYSFSMMAQSDAVVADLAANKVDIALLPANLAVNYYINSNGAIKLVDINTMGAMYVLSNDSGIHSIADLKGKTLYMTGKSSVPQAVVDSLVCASGLSTADIDIQYKSEATEVISSILQNPGSAGIVNEPQATLACQKNTTLKCVINLQSQWRQLKQGEIVTGVSVVRTEYLNLHEDEVKKFLSDHEDSVKFAKENPDEAVSVLSLDGTGDKDSNAQAVERCNICCISGVKAKEILQPFLQSIYESNQDLLKGGLPDDNFYLMMS